MRQEENTAAEEDEECVFRKFRAFSLISPAQEWDSQGEEKVPEQGRKTFCQCADGGKGFISEEICGQPVDCKQSHKVDQNADKGVKPVRRQKGEGEIRPPQKIRQIESGYNPQTVYQNGEHTGEEEACEEPASFLQVILQIPEERFCAIPIRPACPVKKGEVKHGKDDGHETEARAGRGDGNPQAMVYTPCPGLIVEGESA